MSGRGGFRKSIGPVPPPTNRFYTNPNSPCTGLAMDTRSGDRLLRNISNWSYLELAIPVQTCLSAPKSFTFMAIPNDQNVGTHTRRMVWLLSYFNEKLKARGKETAVFIESVYHKRDGQDEKKLTASDFSKNDIHSLRVRLAFESVANPAAMAADYGIANAIDANSMHELTKILGELFENVKKMKRALDPEAIIVYKHMTTEERRGPSQNTYMGRENVGDLLASHLVQNEHHLYEACQMLAFKSSERTLDGMIRLLFDPVRASSRNTCVLQQGGHRRFGFPFAVAQISALEFLPLNYAYFLFPHVAVNRPRADVMQRIMEHHSQASEVEMHRVVTDFCRNRKLARDQNGADAKDGEDYVRDDIEKTMQWFAHRNIDPEKAAELARNLTLPPLEEHLSLDETEAHERHPEIKVPEAVHQRYQNTLCLRKLFDVAVTYGLAVPTAMENPTSELLNLSPQQMMELNHKRRLRFQAALETKRVLAFQKACEKHKVKTAEQLPPGVLEQVLADDKASADKLKLEFRRELALEGDAYFMYQNNAPPAKASVVRYIEERTRLSRHQTFWTTRKPATNNLSPFGDRMTRLARSIELYGRESTSHVDVLAWIFAAFTAWEHGYKDNEPLLKVHLWTFGGHQTGKTHICSVGTRCLIPGTVSRMDEFTDKSLYPTPRTGSKVHDAHRSLVYLMDDPGQEKFVNAAPGAVRSNARIHANRPGDEDDEHIEQQRSGPQNGVFGVGGAGYAMTPLSAAMASGMTEWQYRYYSRLRSDKEKSEFLQDAVQFDFGFVWSITANWSIEKALAALASRFHIIHTRVPQREGADAENKAGRLDDTFRSSAGWEELTEETRDMQAHTAYTNELITIGCCMPIGTQVARQHLQKLMQELGIKQDLYGGQLMRTLDQVMSLAHGFCINNAWDIVLCNEATASDIAYQAFRADVHHLAIENLLIVTPEMVCAALSYLVGRYIHPMTSVVCQGFKKHLLANNESEWPKANENIFGPDNTGKFGRQPVPDPWRCARVVSYLDSAYKYDATAAWVLADVLHKLIRRSDVGANSQITADDVHACILNACSLTTTVGPILADGPKRERPLMTVDFASETARITLLQKRDGNTVIPKPRRRRADSYLGKRKPDDDRQDEDQKNQHAPEVEADCFILVTFDRERMKLLSEGSPFTAAMNAVMGHAHAEQHDMLLFCPSSFSPFIFKTIKLERKAGKLLTLLNRDYAPLAQRQGSEAMARAAANSITATQTSRRVAGATAMQGLVDLAYGFGSSSTMKYIEIDGSVEMFSLVERQATLGVAEMYPYATTAAYIAKMKDDDKVWTYPHIYMLPRLSEEELMKNEFHAVILNRIKTDATAWVPAYLSADAADGICAQRSTAKWSFGNGKVITNDARMTRSLRQTAALPTPEAMELARVFRSELSASAAAFEQSVQMATASLATAAAMRQVGGPANEQPMELEDKHNEPSAMQDDDQRPASPEPEDEAIEWHHAAAAERDPPLEEEEAADSNWKYTAAPANKKQRIESRAAEPEWEECNL